MPDILSVYAQSQPGKLAVVDDKPDGTVVAWTYAELEAQANRVANLLLSLGAGPGTKVLWCGPNSPEVVAVINASRKIGAIAVPLNYRLTAEEACLRHRQQRRADRLRGSRARADVRVAPRQAGEASARHRRRRPFS